MNDMRAHHEALRHFRRLAITIERAGRPLDIDECGTTDPAGHRNLYAEDLTPPQARALQMLLTTPLYHAPGGLFRRRGIRARPGPHVRAGTVAGLIGLGLAALDQGRLTITAPGRKLAARAAIRRTRSQPAR